ncbi:hypothetical protein SAMN05216360_101536 [Methylobacterium phyllostachyos]|uniref:Uncharacterized protein n=1 Tax=Methylobacterium phyllostachyos TaxID=582672 RepID=A0A1G9S8N8_9HYPH|nr:hypothetical protein [Methylobacterium phyllostachyos]SDM31741.1 hypothetical protein SAMN05216360_101536 [Methylobacterium phyllostachyos]
MFTIFLFLVSVGLVAAAAATAAHRPLPLDFALPVGALGLAWRNTGERQTRNGKRMLWKAEGDTTRYSRAYSADREGMRELGFSWDGSTPVCWEPVPAPVPYTVEEAIAAAEARADSADRAKKREALAAAEAEWAANGAARAEAIDALRACLKTRAWAWNKRKRELAESLLGDRPSDRDARIARELVAEVEYLVQTITARLGQERVAEWWERAAVPEVRAAAHEACQVLSDMDGDWATVRNARGWSAAHSHAGHVLASLPALGQPEASHALRAVWAHQRQIPAYLRERVFGSPEV